MYTICLVEDEIDLSNLIKTYLEKENYKVVQFFSGKDALDYVDDNPVSLWILDIMLNDDISGYDIIKKIRKKNETVPVIFTSARDKDIDKIIGLEMGSDDYLAKPFSTKELVLRVNRLIDRVYKTNTNSEINYEGYVVDLNKRVVYLNDKDVKLTTLEFDLLILFLNNKNQTFSREGILKSIWGDNYFGSDRAVDDLVRRLRKKMSNLKIITIYGYGYRLS